VPYANTPNSGGVYIMAICSLEDGYPVDPKNCKYDAFKINSPDGPPGHEFSTPAISKTGSGAYDRTFKWDIAKAADKTSFEKVSGSVTVNYTVTVHHDAGTISNVKVTGDITVTNPNLDDDNNVVDLDITSVTDKLDGNSCSVTGGGAQTISTASKKFAYSCTLSAVPTSDIDNVATVAWPAQILDTGAVTDAGSTDFTLTIHPGDFTANDINGCVNVSDDKQGDLGQVCTSDPNPDEIKYSRSLAAVADQCTTYDNTATITPNAAADPYEASASVVVCGSTGGLTIGFWSNQNGQGLIKTYSSVALRTYLLTFNPFKDLSPTANGTQLASYVAGIITAATFSSSDKTCNPMVRAQMLATALNVFYTGTGFTSTQIGSVKPPSNFLGHTNLGGIKIDLKNVCFPIPSCSANVDASSVFGPADALTVQQALDFQNTVATAPTGASWYGQDKAKQVLAKDVFDAINNHVIFVAPSNRCSLSR
jgi:hypothetical protein